MSTPGCSCADESKPNQTSSNPKLPSFLNQVLYSLQSLLSQPKYRCGVSLKTLAKFMKCTYNLSGDVLSQVETSMLQAANNGLVYEAKSKYFVLGAIAKVQQCDNPCKRKALAEDTMSVFMYKSNVKSTCGRKKRKKKCKGDLLDRSNTSILNLLTKLECVLKERNKKPCDKLYVSNLQMANMRAAEKPCCLKSNRNRKKPCEDNESSDSSKCSPKCPRKRKKKSCKKV